ncbi:putative Serpin family protein [Medicago truncatula]|uniref:Putative Serpin family protein n=1 Tax=Medicago truncatula TaxID=3880 RepID=G7J439_MEDTR|nr:serpin-ZX-like protein [Medicago truncatula]RHN70952.1 putative Serpin family protein [Medicago truncatula]
MFVIGVFSHQIHNISKTKDYDFHLLNGSSVKVPFMTSNKKQFIEVYDDFKVLHLPYKKGEDKRQFSMYFFLPNAKDGLSALVEKVSSTSEFLHRSLCLSQKELGNFKIPKFNISFELEATRMLKKLGVVLPFSPGGFTKMVDSSLMGKILSVSNIFHKSFIEVNEEGVEAAAATAAILSKGFSFPSQLDFVADHPFLFLIREDLTGTIIFVGQVLNPLTG